MNHTNDFFVGWQQTPAVAPRRFFLGCAGVFAFGMTAMGGLLASQQQPMGTGKWQQSAVRNWRGRLVTQPYPMLVTHQHNGSGEPICYLLSCLGKCGVAQRLDAMKDHASVRITGSLIERGTNRMIAAIDGPDWIGPDEKAAGGPEVTGKALGPVRITGEILDSKCWFGAMRPGEGKVHKSCASLCIRSGIPPAVRSETSRAIFILSQYGQAHGSDLLPLVADRVQIVGQVIKRANLLFLDAPVSSVTRL